MSGSVTAKELKECFEAFDLDGDGLLSRKDLSIAVRALGKNPTEKELSDFFESLGKNQVAMDFATFKSCFGKPFKVPYDQDKDMRDAFKILDADGDGTMLESELRQLLLTVGEPMTHQEVDSLMQDVAVDGNGKVQTDKLVDLIVNGCPPGQDTF